jgi:hypothetical protein
MQTKRLNENVLLACSPFGQVEKCPCDGYDVSIPHLKLHFSRDDFAALLTLLRQAKEMESLFLCTEGAVRHHDSFSV